MLTVRSLRVNGVLLEGEALEEWKRKNGPKHKANFRAIVESKKAPGGHSTLWSGGGHESLSTALPETQAHEHLAYLKEAGVVGVELRSLGNGFVAPVTSSPGAKKEYLKAIGKVDVSGCNLNADQTKLKKPGEKDFKAAAKRVRESQPEKVGKLKWQLEQMRAASD